MKASLLIFLVLALPIPGQQTRVPTPIQTGSPFSTPSEIIVDSRGNKIERNIAPDTVKYEINYDDGSAWILAKKGGHLASLEPNDKWRVRCNKDAMSDDVSCVASLHDLVIGLTKWKGGLLHSVIIGTNQYPGSTVAIRFDDDPPIKGGRINTFAFDNAEAIVARLAKAKKVTTRYRKWPQGVNVDSTWEVYGFDEVLRYMQWAITRIH